jgi:hypothetical protein
MVSQSGLDVRDIVRCEAHSEGGWKRRVRLDGGLEPVDQGKRLGRMHAACDED